MGQWDARAGASAAAGDGQSGVSHRQVAQNGLRRMSSPWPTAATPRAQTVLALDYLRGQGVTGDDAAAQRWSLAAAVQGQPVAQYLLGTLYLEGNSDDERSGALVPGRRGAGQCQGDAQSRHRLCRRPGRGEGSGRRRRPGSCAPPSKAIAIPNSIWRCSMSAAKACRRTRRAALKWYLIAASQGDAPSARARRNSASRNERGRSQAGAERWRPLSAAAARSPPTQSTAGPRTVSLAAVMPGPDLGEFRAQQKNLRRIIDPDQQHDHAGRRAIDIGIDDARQIKRDQRLAAPRTAGRCPSRPPPRRASAAAVLGSIL